MLFASELLLIVHMNLMQFMRNERNHSILYTTTTSTHFQEQKLKKIIKGRFCLSFSLLYLFIGSCKFVITETGAYDIAHDESAMGSLIIQSMYQDQIECSHRCSITKTVLKNFAIFTEKYLDWSPFLIKNYKQRYLKETPSQVLSCEYCRIFKITCFKEHL